ncbi:hypothetical protein [Rothia nasimurium]|uniref:hypothetical protein n=1 Tax=Rothia nasimurium TaxID=85336 RepID=UPI001F16F666|nr:hypothetical protein [Rothia nasimurium]
MARRQVGPNTQTGRPGMSNNRWFRGADSNRTDATITGYKLATNDSCPYLLPASAPVSSDAG